MPGSDREYDLVRVKDASSNSKADTFFVAPKHVGRDGAGTERMVLAEVEEPPTPEAGEQYLFLGTDGTLKAKFADGSVTPIDGADSAPDDAEYVTLASDPDLSAESVHQNLSGTELHDPAFHASRHESGGVDEINVQALSGVLGERQFPRTHASDHSEGGRDPIDVDSLVDADLKADLSSPDGTVLSSQIPDLAVTETFTVPDQAGRLALSDVQEGDVALQTDTDEGYIFTGGDPSLDANWSLLSNFDPPVDSVFGRVGDVVAQAGDYAASQISNFSSAVLSAIDGASITPNDVTATSTTTQTANVTTLRDEFGQPDFRQTEIERVDIDLSSDAPLDQTITLPNPDGIRVRFRFHVVPDADPTDAVRFEVDTGRGSNTDYILGTPTGREFVTGDPTMLLYRSDDSIRHNVHGTLNITSSEASEVSGMFGQIASGRLNSGSKYFIQGQKNGSVLLDDIRFTTGGTDLFAGDDNQFIQVLSV